MVSKTLWDLIWNTADIPGHPLSRRINWNGSRCNDQTDGHYLAGGTRACLTGKRKGIQKVSRNTSGKTKHQGKKNSYIGESGIRWKYKLFTNSVDDRICFLSLRRARLWHILPVEVVEQEIHLESTCSRIPAKKDCAQQGCLRSRRLHLVVPCAPGGGGGRPLFLVVWPPVVPASELSAWFNKSSAVLPSPWLKCYVHRNIKVLIFCSQQYLWLLFCFSSTIHSSHLNEKLSISIWLLSFMRYYIYCVIILSHCWTCTAETISQWRNAYCPPFLGLPVLFTASNMNSLIDYTVPTSCGGRLALFNLQKNHISTGQALYNKAISCA